MHDSGIAKAYTFSSIRDLVIRDETDEHDRAPHRAYMPKWFETRRLGMVVHTPVGTLLRDEQLCDEIVAADEHSRAALVRPYERLCGKEMPPMDLCGSFLDFCISGPFKREGHFLREHVRHEEEKQGIPHKVRIGSGFHVERRPTNIRITEKTTPTMVRLTEKTCFMEIVEAMGPYTPNQFRARDIIHTSSWGPFRILDKEVLFRLNDFRAYLYKRFNGCWARCLLEDGAYRDEADPMTPIPFDGAYRDCVAKSFLARHVRSSKLECAKKAMHAMHQRIQDEAWSDEQIRKAWNLLHKESGWDISEYA